MNTPLSIKPSAPGEATQRAVDGDLAHRAPPQSEPAPELKSPHHEYDKGFSDGWDYCEDHRATAVPQNVVGRYVVRGGRVVEWEIDNGADERADGTYPLYTSSAASGNPATARCDGQMNGEAK